MKEEYLLLLYGELMQLANQSGDYLAKAKYKAKLEAIDVLLEEMPYGLDNGIIKQNLP